MELKAHVNPRDKEEKLKTLLEATEARVYNTIGFITSAPTEHLNQRQGSLTHGRYSFSSCRICGLPYEGAGQDRA